MDEVDLAISVSADSAPVVPDEPQPPLAIAARFQPVLNAALLHNSVPALCELAIENTSDRDFAQVTLHLDSEPPVFAPRTWTIQHIAAGQIRAVRDLDVQLDASFVMALTEAMPCRARLAVREGAAVLATRCEEIRLLPANFWGGVVGLPDILAAFVEPNDPVVARIVRSASDLLRAQGRREAGGAGGRATAAGTGRAGRFLPRPVLVQGQQALGAATARPRAQQPGAASGIELAGCLRTSGGAARGA